MSKKQDWVITTSGDRPVSEVAKELKKSGFTVGQVLEEIGVITGAASEDVVGKVRSIRGVADVSRDSAIDIGPPGSPETW